MADTSERMLRLLSLLQSRRYWAGVELSERLEISERTLRRDIDRLRLLGYPVDAQRGVAGGYELAPGASLPPLVLDDEEAVALAVGLHAAIQAASISDIADSALRALEKIAQVMPTRLRHEVDALTAMTVPVGFEANSSNVDADLLMRIARSCRESEQISFLYVARDDTFTAREVEPYRLVLVNRRWYLLAFDLRRFDWRTFRVDRLSQLQPTTSVFHPRELPARDLAAYMQTQLSNVSLTYTAEVRVSLNAEQVHQRIGTWATIVPIDEHQCTIFLSTESLDWMAMALGVLDCDFTVVSPEVLIEHLHKWSRRFAAADT